MTEIAENHTQYDHTHTNQSSDEDDFYLSKPIN